ncbi:Ig-like domain-containing protein [Methanosphaera sp. BMS]|uniref:Ig-like domain-containing protein n=1 Tax=Methanosphaera sp. BMS TaxID=1789762 RepID=UPI000DC1DF2D|nr:Ig-like domain-containing protein [Methanosphaera sp. BMS]AWX33390.1 hypothetical protein AW729_09925 [Methanosphaera sp. BMS]
MTKNIKSIFFVLTLVTLLATVGAVCAADDANSTAAADSSLSDVASVSDTIVTETATTSNDNVNTKMIEKEDKNLKTTTKTVEVNDYNELKTAINTAVNDADNQEYIINLKESEYNIGWSMSNNANWGGNSPIYKSIIINGNHQTLQAGTTNIYINSGSNITINDLVITGTGRRINNGNLTLVNQSPTVAIENNGNLSLIKSVINNTINNGYNLTIDNETVIGTNTNIMGLGIININYIDKLLPYMMSYNGTYTFENVTINKYKSNYGNLTYINCNLNDEIDNMDNGTLTLKNCTITGSLYLYGGSVIIDNECTFGTNFFLYVDKYGSGKIIMNNSNKIYPYINSFSGNNTLTNISINKTITNNGNLTLNNVTINSAITNNGNLTIDDYTIFGENFLIANYGNIIINDTDKLIPYQSIYNGSFTFSNMNINTFKQNYGNLTLVNCTVNAALINQNYANLTLYNCTMTKRMENYGNIYLINNTTFSGNLDTNYGNIFINNSIISSNQIMQGTITTYEESTLSCGSIQYATVIISNETIINTSFYGCTLICDDGNKIYPYTESFSGNTTLTNMNINKTITNNGNLTLKNCTLNKTITNNGILIINDETVLGENLVINGNGEITINDTNKIVPHLSTYKGNYTLENTTITTTKTNNGNLTIKNSTLNSTIINNGNLTISDDCIIGDNCQITGNGQLIMNDTTRVGIYSGNIIKENTVINKSITIPDDGNVTFINSNITAPITNNGNLTFNTSILNSTITNNANLTIDDNTIIGENFLINNYGDITINDINRILPHFTQYNRDYTIENQTIITDKTNTGNLKLINCNISAKITNEGNITLINCSLSNNYMNNQAAFTPSASLFSNLGNASVINCIFENNTFNISNNKSSNFYKLGGAIVNRGNLSIINTTFRNNTVGYAMITDKESDYHYDYGVNFGDGSCIYNQAGTVLINNSLFEDNYSGKNGGAIISNSYMDIINTTFYNNTATQCGGAILITNGDINISDNEFINNKIVVSTNGGNTVIYGGAAISIGIGEQNTRINSNVSVNNTLFKQNHFETISSTFGSRRGNTIYRQDGILTIDNCTFTEEETGNTMIVSSNNHRTELMINTITNSYFYNNIGSGFIIDDGTDPIMKIINNTFTNNNNQILIYGTADYIINNTFIDNNCSSNTINTNNESAIIENNSYYNTTITDNITLNTPNKIYSGEPITITGTYQILGSNYDNNILDQNQFQVYINGRLNQTVDNLEFSITPTTGTMMLTVQPTISQTRKTIAIRATTLSNITITPENYNEYIYEGTLLGVGKDSKVLFQGDFTDKGEIYIDTNDIILDGSNATFTNTEFTLDAENITIQNMNIINSETTYPIANYQNNNIITNNTISITNIHDKTATIYTHASNTIIENNTLTVSGPANTIDHSIASIADTQAILLIGGNNNIIQNNDIIVNSSGINTAYGTIEAITNSNGATNTLIRKNRINITGANFNYAINSLTDVENILITDNTIQVNGERYCDGIQVGNGANNITIDNNNITCICINNTPLNDEGAITYGVIATSMGSAESNNITITNNNIDITGTVNYAIELYKVNNTEIHNNNITVTGPYSLGIGYSYAPNGNAIGNHININGDSTTPINQITEEIKPENTGIRIQNGTQNIYMEANTITTSDVGGQDTTIHSDEESVTAINNRLTSSKGYGDETIIAPETADISDNVIYPKINIEDITTIINTPTTLQATVTTIDGNNINTGTVYFKDISRRIIASADVINGTAQVDHIFKETTNTLMYVVYNSTSSGIAMIETMITLTVKDKFQTTIRIDEVNPTAGETVSITAHITDENDEAITGGKVSFKVNGKTVKDANGKVVYAKVVDGVATAQYTVPENLGGQDINITAVYTGTSKYNKETTTITTTVTAPEAKITITPITSDVQTGSTVTLKAKVAIGDKAITTGKIVFKINGKTVKDENGKVIYAKVNANGEVSVDYTIPESFKAGTYNIEAVFTASGYEKLTDNTTMTVVKS